MHIRGVDFVPTRRVGEAYPYISLMNLSEGAEGSQRSQGYFFLIQLKLSFTFPSYHNLSNKSFLSKIYLQMLSMICGIFSLITTFSSNCPFFFMFLLLKALFLIPG